jgi:hypothetical protein
MLRLGRGDGYEDVVYRALVGRLYTRQETKNNQHAWIRTVELCNDEPVALSSLTCVIEYLGKAVMKTVAKIWSPH